MDIPFVNATYEQFMRNIQYDSKNRNKRQIVTANPEIVMATREDAEYKQIVQAADYVVPDGIGVVLAAKLKRQALQERIAGFDVMTGMLEIANEEGLSCFFLGAKAEINDRAVEEIITRYPNLHVAGKHHGYIEVDDADVQKLVVESGADFIFVALGFPKQEKFIARCKPDCDKGIFIGVGGSFDVFAGNVKRAPAFWIKWNLEWLYRLLKQPFRWKRMMPIVKFLWLVVRGRS